MTPLPDPAPGVPVHVVVMGVSGCGKSTVARALHERLGWEYAEGDAYHPQANIDKMAGGRPLVDEDRWPWLRILADWTAERDARGEPTILACSALRRPYRELLREGGEGTYFVHMHGDKGLLLERGASANAKPELEIFADDVKCAHGAAIGEMDEMARRYCRTA